MKSPVAKHQTLERVTLDDELFAFRCPETGGFYIRSENYWRWQKHAGDRSEDRDPAGADAPVSEYDDTIELCPESGTLMTRYRVGHGLPFRVDRSVTGGVWLDAGEWEALHSGGLHRNLHLVFMLIPMLHDFKRASHGEILRSLARISEAGSLTPVRAVHSTLVRMTECKCARSTGRTGSRDGGMEMPIPRVAPVLTLGSKFGRLVRSG